MRRTEDVSFEYGKKQNAAQVEVKAEPKAKKSFNIEKTKKPADVKVKKGFWEIIYEWMDSFVFSIILILLVFTFCFRIVGVDGESMMPTLNHGDWLTVKAINTEIERGDIVVVTQPNNLNEPLIKRVIAVGGDSLKIDFVTGEVEVNGRVIDEPYIMEETHNRGDFDTPVIIPEGYVFVMGDNRNESLDSRFDSVGVIDERYILGVADTRVYPFGEWEIY